MRYWCKSADVNLRHLYLVPPLAAMSLEFRQDFWRRKTRVSGLLYGVVSVILGLGIFVQLRLLTDDRQTDRQTDGQMDRQTDTRRQPIPGASTALRGNKTDTKLTTVNNKPVC